MLLELDLQIFNSAPPLLSLVLVIVVHVLRLIPDLFNLKQIGGMSVLVLKDIILDLVSEHFFLLDLLEVLDQLLKEIIFI